MVPAVSNMEMARLMPGTSSMEIAHRELACIDKGKYPLILP
jgi:hypothetical protein